jgi:hypothetical protein
VMKLRPTMQLRNFQTGRRCLLMTFRFKKKE